MDHKVSKDMISSGMIPSGEKTQADLGRIQYGSAPSPSSLMDAYRSIYEHHQKDKDGNTIPHEGEQLNEGKMPEGLKNYLMKKGKKKDKEKVEEAMGGAVKTTTKMMGDIKYQVDEIPTPTKTKPTKPTQELKSKPVSQMNDVDLFDLVKGKLIDEGYEEKEVIKIMINLSEDQLNELLGGVKGDGYLGHPNAGIKNPFAKQQIKKPVMPNAKGGGLLNKTAGQLGDRKMELQKLMKGM